jgi:hypothetical protein
MSFLPLARRRSAADDGVMMLIVVAILMLLAWAAISFGPEDSRRYRC